MAGTFVSAIDSMMDEVDRAEHTHGSLPIHDLPRVAAILTEECGEVAKATLELTRNPPEATKDHLIAEYVQVAAVAIRAVVALENS